MAETEEQSNEEEYVEVERLSRWKIGFAIVAVIALVGTLAGVAAVMFLGNPGDPAEKALAKTSLGHVIDAAEIYRKEHDYVYEGITAAKLKANVSETVVDGMPKKGQVGIMDYNSDQLVLLYLGKTGTEYKATINAGTTVFDF
jgi:hypothetical protein